jgi:DNA modification methylase
VRLGVAAAPASRPSLVSAFEIFAGDALQVLRGMESESVHCCITSPPYWGLRDYGTAKWEGGAADCDHKQVHGSQGKKGQRADRAHPGELPYKGICGKCGAARVDAQIGLEPTPQLYIKRLVGVFREVRRVLREDGTLWMNMGDSYATGGGGQHTAENSGKHGPSLLAMGPRTQPNRMPIPGLKPKDLVIFGRVPAGWHQGTRPATPGHTPGVNPKAKTSGIRTKQNASFAAAVKDIVEFRNKRSVWTIATMPTPEAHFATFPLELPEICLRAGTPEGGLVLDPFAGAGTTGLACLKNNRRFVGIELNPKYIEIAFKRARKYYPLLVQS